MDSLRIILLICGIVLLVGIYMWGITIARRGSRSEPTDDSDVQIENELELLERVQDSRAAHNAGSLKELNEIDIDEEMEQATPVETETETDSAVGERYDSFEALEEEERDDARFRPVFAEEAGERAAGDDAMREKTDLVASLSEIRATLAPDPLIQVDQLDLLPDDDAAQRTKTREQGEQARSKPGRKTDPTPEDLVLAVTVMAEEGHRFPGEELRNWLQALKLRHGDMGLFHYRPPGKPLRAPPTFSVSSVLKPGSFDIEQMEDTTVPGVALFIKLPGPDDPVAAFEEMLRTARKLADGLDGVVCDETRSTLTGQVINHMRERIAEFSRRQRLRF